MLVGELKLLAINNQNMMADLDQTEERLEVVN